MSLEKTDEKLIHFLSQHPEYFDGPKDQKTIRRDIRAAVDLYARSMDAAAYDALRRKVLQFQQHTEERLKRKMAYLIEKKAEEEKRLNELLDEFKKYEGRLSELNSEISQYQTKKEKLVSETQDSDADYKFLILDVIGILLLYNGVILNEQVEMSFVIMSVLCFVGGFLMQKKSKKRVEEQMGPMDALSERLDERCSRLQEMWQIKEVSLTQKKKASMEKIRLFDAEINMILNRIDCGAEQK